MEGTEWYLLHCSESLSRSPLDMRLGLYKFPIKAMPRASSVQPPNPYLILGCLWLSTDWTSLEPHLSSSSGNLLQNLTTSVPSHVILVSVDLHAFSCPCLDMREVWTQCGLFIIIKIAWKQSLRVNWCPSTFWLHARSTLDFLICISDQFLGTTLSCFKSWFVKSHICI